MNKKLWWAIGGLIVFVIILQQKDNTNPTQTVVPNLLTGGCFEKADCYAPIKANYCNIRFDCIQGQCYTENVLCPEICDSGKDEDLDGKTDCRDTDCYSSPLCSCETASFNVCKAGTCWCPEGRSPRWFVSTPNFCSCM